MPLAPGETYIATLCESPDDDSFLRHDFSLSAWEEGRRPESLFSYWRTRVPQPSDRRTPFVDDEVLFDLFERLGDDERPQRRAFRFVLALVLMRKRRLRYTGRSAAHTGEEHETWTFTCKTGEENVQTFEVINPRLSDEDVESLTAQLSEILQHEL